jgi:Immunity protein 27
MELNDVWSIENGRVVPRGDAAAISEMLEQKLEKVRVGESGWISVYRHRETGQLWELSYPQGELQGGGPRRWRLLTQPT